MFVSSYFGILSGPADRSTQTHRLCAYLVPSGASGVASEVAFSEALIASKIRTNHLFSMQT
jgi:hypothetical protein